MTTNNKLQEQIAELTAKHNLQAEVESKLPNLKVYTNFFSYKELEITRTITVYLDTLELKVIASNIERIIAAFQPSKNAKLTFAGSKDQETASPFVLRWKNGIRECKAQIDYVSGETWVHIELPIGYYSDDVKGVHMRKVSDSEHHYFGGVSMAEIRRMDIIAYQLDMFEVVKYYGGDAANYIIDTEDKEEFECVVLYGHTPQFKEFWTKTLTSI